MNWLPHDLATVLAILALFLMYPVSLLANLSTPKLRDWWAARSLEALRKRRNHLLAFQKEISHAPMVDGATDAMLGQLNRLNFAIAQGIHIILTGMLLMLSTVPPPKHSTPILVGFGLLFVTNLAYGVRCSRDATKFHQRVSPSWRARIAWEIENLEAKLAR